MVWCMVFILAPNSSKCHVYMRGVNGYRAMFLWDVCPGIKYPLNRTDQRLRGPPLGYDSVYGLVGGDLNYEEIVLYNPDAVTPRYIIVYKKDGTMHPSHLHGTSVLIHTDCNCEHCYCMFRLITYCMYTLYFTSFSPIVV